MVDNATSMFTQVYAVKKTPTHFLSSFAVYSAIYISFPFQAKLDIFLDAFSCNSPWPNLQWGFCPPFSWWKSRNPSQCNLKLKVKISKFILWLSWWSFIIQDVGIHHAGVKKYHRTYLKTFDLEMANLFHAQLIITIYAIHVSVVQLNFCGWST